ncbi:unnamed protein product [Lathyrus sativus]|nr:unnamed protein product [Lathyrus sativus]
MRTQIRLEQTPQQLATMENGSLRSFGIGAATACNNGSLRIGPMCVYVCMTVFVREAMDSVSVVIHYILYAEN